MHLSRRELLVTGTAVMAVHAVARGAFGQGSGETPLPGLTVQDANENLAIRLEAIVGEHEFVPGVASTTLGFNQPYLGPVVRVRSGATVQAEVLNSTTRTISVHWHGLLIPGEVDGGPHQPIAPGETWRPQLPIDQSRAFLWFHTHIHGETAEGVYAGLAGVLLVDDGEDATRGLPINLGVDDLVLVVQDKRFDEAGRAAYEPTAGDKMHGFLGDTIIVNGAIRPTAVVPAGVVKLRLLNGSNGRNFHFFLSDGGQLHIVASEQGLLAAPIAVDRLRLSPGERTEVLVDFSGRTAVSLMSNPHDEGTGAGGMGHDMAGMVPNEERFTEPFEVMMFRMSGKLPVVVTTIPQLLGPQEDEAPSEPMTTRQFTLNDMGDVVAGRSTNLLDALQNAPPMDHAAHAMPGMAMTMPGAAEPMPGMEMQATESDPMFGINGQPFDMTRIDYELAVGSVERWIIGGQMMGHPFHIHGVRFQVVRDKGGEPRPENRGWKDTVFVDGEVELLVEFKDTAASTAPFMFHCHVLEHEDRGMMGQFTVGTVEPADYAFAIVDAPVWDAGLVRFSVQLIDAVTGRRAADAVIRVLDFNMEPEGMAGGVGVNVLPVVEPGVQPITTVPSMSGRWALVLEAALPGGAVERDTLILPMPERP
ncbi:MAG: multicopper oxidase domain-containing protein [Bauldia sp.]